jgi:hypothetical protein
MHLTIGIRALPLAKEGNNFLFFLQILFSREKRGRCTSSSYMKLSVYNLAKQIGYLNFSRKISQFQKNNLPKWIPGSKFMSILNSVVFQGFSRKSRDFL